MPKLDVKDELERAMNSLVLPKTQLSKALRMAIEGLESSRTCHDDRCAQFVEDARECDCGAHSHNQRVEDYLLMVLEALDPERSAKFNATATS